MPKYVFTVRSADNVPGAERDAVLTDDVPALAYACEFASELRKTMTITRLISLSPLATKAARLFFRYRAFPTEPVAAAVFSNRIYKSPHRPAKLRDLTFPSSQACGQREKTTPLGLKPRDRLPLLRPASRRVARHIP
jgi:hypothetical protein